MPHLNHHLNEQASQIVADLKKIPENKRKRTAKSTVEAFIPIVMESDMPNEFKNWIFLDLIHDLRREIKYKNRKLLKHYRDMGMAMALFPETRTQTTSIADTGDGIMYVDMSSA